MEECTFKIFNWCHLPFFPLLGWNVGREGYKRENETSLRIAAALIQLRLLLLQYFIFINCSYTSPNSCSSCGCSSAELLLITLFQTTLMTDRWKQQFFVARRLICWLTLIVAFLACLVDINDTLYQKSYVNIPRSIFIHLSLSPLSTELKVRNIFNVLLL